MKGKPFRRRRWIVGINASGVQLEGFLATIKFNEIIEKNFTSLCFVFVLVASNSALEFFNERQLKTCFTVWVRLYQFDSQTMMETNINKKFYKVKWMWIMQSFKCGTMLAWRMIFNWKIVVYKFIFKKSNIFKLMNE